MHSRNSTAGFSNGSLWLMVLGIFLGAGLVYFGLNFKIVPNDAVTVEEEETAQTASDDPAADDEALPLPRFIAISQINAEGNPVPLDSTVLQDFIEEVAAVLKDPKPETAGPLLTEIEKKHNKFPNITKPLYNITVIELEKPQDLNDPNAKKTTLLDMMLAIEK